MVAAGNGRIAQHRFRPGACGPVGAGRDAEQVAAAASASPWLFTWLPGQALADATELAARIGVVVVRLEAKPDELIFSLANGNSVRMLCCGH